MSHSTNETLFFLLQFERNLDGPLETVVKNSRRDLASASNRFSRTLLSLPTPGDPNHRESLFARGKGYEKRKPVLANNYIDILKISNKQKTLI